MKFFLRTQIFIILVLLLSISIRVNGESTEVSGTIPLVLLSGPSVTDIKTSSATLNWTTNGLSTSSVGYRLSGSWSDYKFSTGDNNTAHRVTLTGLSAGTTYQYYVKSMTAENLAVESSPDIFTTKKTSSNGGGGGGGDGDDSDDKNPSDTTVRLYGLTSTSSVILDYLGYTRYAVSMSTSDKKITLNILQGSRLLDMAGNPLTSLEIQAVTKPAVSPSGSSLIMAFDFLPQEARFSPSLSLILSYNPKHFSELINENNLYVAEWDGLNWKPLSYSVIDVNSHNISVPIDHSGRYALMGRIVQTTSTSTSIPPSATSSTVSTTAPIKAISPSGTTSTGPSTPVSAVTTAPSLPPVKSAIPQNTGKLNLTIVVLVFIFVATVLVTALIGLRGKPEKEPKGKG